MATSNPAPKILDFGVFYAGQDYRVEAPRFRLPRDEARALRKSGQAWSVNQGRDIALTPETVESLRGVADEREMIELIRSQLSQLMGEKVMRGNAEGYGWARAMTRAWRRNSHPLPRLVKADA